MTADLESVFSAQPQRQEEGDYPRKLIPEQRLSRKWRIDDDTLFDHKIHRSVDIVTVTIIVKHCRR